MMQLTLGCSLDVLARCSSQAFADNLSVWQHSAEGLMLRRSVRIRRQPGTSYLAVQVGRTANNRYVSASVWAQSEVQQSS